MALLFNLAAGFLRYNILKYKYYGYLRRFEISWFNQSNY